MNSQPDSAASESGKPSVERRADAQTASLNRLVWAYADGMLVVTRTGIIKLVNPAAAALFGREVEELLGTEFGFPVVAGSNEIELLTPNGARTVELRIQKTVWADDEVYAVALRDISAHRRQVEELSEAVEAKDAAVASITHELRNPITVITGFAETLRRHWDALSDEEKLDLVDRILTMGERMGGTIRNLLHLSQVESGRTAAHPEIVDISDLLLSRLFEVGDKAAEIRVFCDPGVAAWADPTHVWEILVNFVENGFKYGRPPIDIVVTDEDGMITIRVTDHGDGVPPEFRSRMFQRFARDTSTAHSVEGTGLGLSITKALAEFNGGHVWYEDAPDGGSCFVLRLPTAEAEDRASVNH